VAFLKKAEVTITALDTGHVPLDCDVSPIDNSKTKGAEDFEYAELAASLHH
jgi:hypothetical protein